MARILISGTDVRQEQIAVRSLDAGTAWATRWMRERQAALLRLVAGQMPLAL